MKKITNLKKDKKGIFGLTAVQQFFAVILSIALLAYVIVAIMGTLSTATIIPQNTLSGTIPNETITSVTEAGKALSKSTLDGVICTISRVYNATVGGAGSGQLVTLGTNYTTATNCRIATVEGSDFNNTNLNVSYTYTYNNAQVVNARDILTNTSTGITGFFSAINPVYAILAILVIILVLVVLVRVVQAPNARESAPAL